MNQTEKIGSSPLIQRKYSKNTQNRKQQHSAKKILRFYLGSRQRYIIFSSDFDSGNIQCIKQLTQFQYRLGSVPDNYGTPYHSNSKSWFYFSVTGFPNNTKGRFYIQKVQTLLSIYQSKYQNTYRPVYKIGQQGVWYRLPTQVNLTSREGQTLQVYFDFLFKKETDIVYFAFCYPFSYSQNLKYLQSLGQNIYNDDFYYHQQVLTLSPQKRFVHLLTITSYDQKNKEIQFQQIFDQKLFPEKNRPCRFNKPVILITARVHPGQTPASYALKGLVNFLVNKSDLRAFLLRKMFTFMIVPMINVDGVYKGNFRMDTYGQNLNRYYINPQFQKQPAIYAIKRLAQHLNKDKRLTFYFDLHAHNAKKGCFIYGNAINDFVDQVQSQVFCKLFSMNTKMFQYQSCNFSLKHMKAKDRFQMLTKEGCGRVVMHKLTGIIHSYSLQCGLISSNSLNILPDPINTQFKVGNMGINSDQIEQNTNKLYKTSQPPLYTPQMYQNVGKALLVSVLDTFDKNPYNRVYSSQCKNMQMLRRTMAFQVFHEAQRFRMFERFTFYKVKNINQLMQNNFKVKFNHKKIFNLNDNPLLTEVQWPINIIGLKTQKFSQKQHMSYQYKNAQKRLDNLYTQTSQDNQNEIYEDILIKIKQGEQINQQTVKQFSVDPQQLSSPGLSCKQNCQRQFSAIKPRMIYEQSKLQQQQNKRQQSLSVRVRKLFKNEMRKQFRDQINQNRQQILNLSVQIKKQNENKHYKFGIQSQDLTSKLLQKRNTTAFNSKLTKKNLPNLTIQNCMNGVRTSIVGNMIIGKKQQKFNNQYPNRRDLRIDIQKKRIIKSKKQQQKQKDDNNLKKLQIYDTDTDKTVNSSKYISNSKNKLINDVGISQNRSKQFYSQYNNYKSHKNRCKQNEIMSAKLDQVRKSNSKFPDLINQEKLQKYQYSTNGTFGLQDGKPDLNQLLKSVLKFECLNMKDMMTRSISRSKN